MDDLTWLDIKSLLSSPYIYCSGSSAAIGKRSWWVQFNFYLNSMLHDRYVLPLWTNITYLSDCVRGSQRVFLFENTFALQSSPNSNQWSLSGLDWAPTLRYLRTKVFQQILFPRVILFIHIKSFVFILTSLSFLWGHCIVAIEVIWTKSNKTTTFFRETIPYVNWTPYQKLRQHQSLA